MLRSYWCASALLSLGALSGCDSAQRRWAGFTLGERAPDVAKPATGPWPDHKVELPIKPGFPWQTALAQVDAQGRVVAVTLRTTCCDEPPMEDVNPSKEEVASRRRAELEVPDRFRDGLPPPVLVNASSDTNRVISWGDMLAYGRSALRAAVVRLGRPTTAKSEPSFYDQGLSYLDDGRVFRTRWSRPGDRGPVDFAVLDVGKVSNCLTVAADNIPHPPIVGGCEGLDRTCIKDWYPVPQPAPRTSGTPLPVPPSPPPDPQCERR